MSLENYTEFKLQPVDQLDHPVVSKIRSFEKLKKGWCHGRGVAPVPQTIERALELHNAMLRYGFTHADVFPGENGEIQLNLYYRNHYLEFILECDGHVTFVREDDDTEMEFIENMSTSQAKQKIQELCKKCDLLESSTPDTMITQKKDLRVLLSETLVTMGEFPLSNQIAFQPLVV
jgi:hypothetical protein